MNAAKLSECLTLIYQGSSVFQERWCWGWGRVGGVTTVDDKKSADGNDNE